MQKFKAAKSLTGKWELATAAGIETTRKPGGKKGIIRNPGTPAATESAYGDREVEAMRL